MFEWAIFNWLVLGGPFFWTIVAVVVVAECIAAVEDRNGPAYIIAGIFFAALLFFADQTIIFGEESLFLRLIDNWINVVYCIGGFIVGSIFWSIFKARDFGGDLTREFKKVMKRWFTVNVPSKKKLSELSAEEKQRLWNYMGDNLSYSPFKHRRHDDDLTQEQIEALLVFNVSDHWDKITFWAVWWPFSLLSFCFYDAIRKICYKLSGVYGWAMNSASKKTREQLKKDDIMG